MGGRGFAPDGWFMRRKLHDRAGNICGLSILAAIANAADVHLKFGE